MLKENKLPLGEYMDGNQMYYVNLNDSFVYNVVGEENTGKTSIMKVIMSLAATNKKDKIYVVDFTNKLYAKVAQRLKVNYITTVEEFSNMLEMLAEEFSSRKETPKDEKIYIFGDMERFIKAIYRTMKSGVDAKEFMENISQKGSGYNIYFIMEMGLEAERKLKGYEVYNNFINYKTGISTSECDFGYEKAENVNIPVIRG